VRLGETLMSSAMDWLRFCECSVFLLADLILPAHFEVWRMHAGLVSILVSPSLTIAEIDQAEKLSER
jgi:hypothetical protein